MKKIWLILLAITITSSAIAQEKWSLEKCISHAQENNLTVQRMVLQANYSETTLKQSKENLIPSVSGTAGYSYLLGRAVNPYTNQFTTESNHSLNFSLGASVVLFDGMRNINTIKKNKLDMLASQESIERVKRDVSLEVGLAFLLVLRNEEILNSAKAQVETTKAQVERTKKLVNAGSLAEGALLEINAQQASEEVQVVDAENQLNIATLNLTQLLELPSISNFSIEKPNLDNLNAESLKVSVEEIFSQIDQLPEIKEAQLKLQSAEKSLTIAKGAYSPELSASAGIYSGYSSARQHAVGDPTITSQQVGTVESSGEIVTTPMPQYQFETIAMGTQLSDNLNQQVGLTLRIPIYSQGRIRQQSSNAKIGILEAKNSIETIKRNVYKNVQQAHADAFAALARYRSNSASVIALEKSFEYIQQKHSVGAANTFEYNQAKNNLFKANASLTQAKYDYIFRLTILDFYMGKPLNF